MAGERTLKRLGEICEFRGGQGFPQKHQGAIIGEYPFIKVSDMELPGNRHRITRANHWIDEATRKELHAKPHPATSTVFAKIGIALTYNRRRLLSRPTIVDNNMMAAVPIESEVVPVFLYYLLKATDFNEVVSGTALPFINGSDLAKMEVEIPPLLEQRAIAKVLEALDEKIELNHRMNATLAAMARALFQNWFVDFNPVRAKLDGRKPTGLDEATTALFPATFQNSPLGPIPQGWEVATVGAIGDVVCGKTPPTAVSDYYGEDVPFITIPDMHGNVFAASTARKLSQAGANSQANKTLPPGSLCVSCIATPGLVVITSEDSQTNQQINSVVPHQTQETYFWYWVLTGLGAEIASSGSGGSVLANLSKGRFETLQVINPPHTLIHAYHTTVRPLFENILANTHQSRTLATLRDALLPKLLSGELGVAEIPSKPN